jgi:predicted alpha/beta hydrolase family esterase
MIEAQKSALIFPDTISAGPEPTPWVHALKNIMRPRFGYDFNVGASLSSPDEHASSYAEWLPWIQEHYGDFYLSREQSSLVGHGLGSPALLRLLERQSRRIDRVYLLSTPLGIGEIGHAAEIESFLGGYEFDWERIRASARAFHIFHGRDDPRRSGCE